MSSQSQSRRPRETQKQARRPYPVQAPPSKPKKAVPDGFVDPTEGIVFPTRRRLRR